MGSNPILSATFTHTVRSRALHAFYAMNRLILTSVAGADCPDATKNEGLASLDFGQAARNLKAVALARSRLFACLVLLILATVGVFAVEHCACDDVSADCEHAGEVCAQPDDCSDCLVPSGLAALADEPTTLLPSANVSLGSPILAPVFAYAERRAAETARPVFISRSSACRPLALRAGTMCLRV